MRRNLEEFPEIRGGTCLKMKVGRDMDLWKESGKTEKLLGRTCGNVFKELGKGFLKLPIEIYPSSFHVSSS